MASMPPPPPISSEELKSSSLIISGCLSRRWFLTQLFPIYLLILCCILLFTKLQVKHGSSHTCSRRSSPTSLMALDSMARVPFEAHQPPLFPQTQARSFPKRAVPYSFCFPYTYSPFVVKPRIVHTTAHSQTNHPR